MGKDSRLELPIQERAIGFQTFERNVLREEAKQSGEWKVRGRESDSANLWLLLMYIILKKLMAKRREQESEPGAET